jgi:hypothetical protein
MESDVDVNSVSKVCTVTTNEEDTKRNQYSEHGNVRRKIHDNYHKKNEKVKSVI